MRVDEISPAYFLAGANVHRFPMALFKYIALFFLPEEHLYSSKGPYSLLTVKAT